MADGMNRRDAMGIALGTCAAVGGVFSLAGMKKAWDPLPSVKAAGTTTVDLSVSELNTLYTEVWRGKPIFILKKPKEMVEASSEIEKARDVIVGNDRYLVAIGLCTHLGCIPSYRKETKDFLCACHGATYDMSAINTKAPAPLPLEIPPFKIEGSSLVIGEEGEQYIKMKEAAVLGYQPLKSKA